MIPALLARPLSPTVPWQNEGPDNATTVLQELLPPVTALTNSQGGDDRVRARVIVTYGRFDQGPAAQPVYFNTVVSMGLNLGSGGVLPLNPAMAAGRFAIESKFASAASPLFGMEFHIALRPVDDPSNGTEFRAWSAYVPHKMSDWALWSAVSYASAQHIFNDGLLNPRVQFDLRPGYGTITFQRAGAEPAPKLAFAENNRAMLTQLDATGNNYLLLGFIDADNMEQHTNAQYVAAQVKANSNLGVTALHADLATGCTAGSYGRYLLFIGTNAGAVPGDFYSGKTEGSATGTLFETLQNNHAAGSAVFEVACPNNPAGAQFRVNGEKVVGPRQPAIADTSGATLADLEATVNALKALLRTHGLMAA